VGLCDNKTDGDQCKDMFKEKNLKLFLWTHDAT